MNRLYSTIAVSVLFGAVAGGLILNTFLGTAARPGFCEKPRHHCIKVTVDATDSAAPVLKVDADTLVKKGKNRTIHWMIDNDNGQNFTFPSTASDKGIEFTEADGAAEFQCSIDLADDPNYHTYSCDDPDGKPKSAGYKYKVKVTGSGIIPSPLDPKIVNQ